MKIHATYISDDNTKYPAEKGEVDTLVWELPRDTRSVLLGFGNGVFLEMRVLGDSEEALTRFRTIMRGGGYNLIEPSRTRNRVWLYQEGDECYGGCVFIDPTPHPEIFLNQ